jgi:hypothetical protein
VVSAVKMELEVAIKSPTFKVIISRFDLPTKSCLLIIIIMCFHLYCHIDEVTKVLSDLLVCFVILEDLAAIQVLHHSSIFMPILFLCVHR